MAYDQEAIYKAYPNVVNICDKASDGKGFIKDEDGNDVTIDQSLVDAARVELDKLKYKEQRKNEYPQYGEQFDYIYHNGIDKWKTDIVDPVKAKYPKPS